jgi:hypothetical protein
LFPRFSGRRTHFACRGQELGQPHDVVSGDREDEHGAHFVEAAHLQLRKPAYRLAPAEAFLDAFAQPLADRVPLADVGEVASS